MVAAFGMQKTGIWDLSEPAAIVNKTVITKGELLERLMADFGEETLKQLITLRLLEQEAEREGITVTEAEIQQRFEELRARREDLSKQLGRGRLSDLTLRDEAKRLILLERLISKRVEVSEKELRDFYNRHFIRYNRPERVQIREIIVSTLQEAQEIYRQLMRTPPAKLAGEFERLSRERSVIPGRWASSHTPNCLKRCDCPFREPNRTRSFPNTSDSFRAIDLPHRLGAGQETRRTQPL